ncbi:MAG: gamma-glutamyltransferase family protein, partial [Acidimicrobiia bacterium]|nr:gamma-glutamyltransferase family protein [Acidimicrobiia bacterium]
MPLPRLEPTRRAGRAMVCTIDHVASAAGAQMLAAGGSAADAAVAASAVLAVTTQHMCGMGGDLWALVHDGPGAPAALNSSGRAGSGSDPERLRSEGHAVMPFRGDIRSVPVPGCVDGWITLHQRYGRLDVADVLAPAIAAAEAGFAPTDHLDMAIPRILDVNGADDFIRYHSHGGILTRPGLGRSLRAIAAGGRDRWYQGEFGEGLLALGQGLYSEADLARSCANWVEPLRVDRWGHALWTVPPNSQGYLTLLGAEIAAELLQPDHAPDDPRWAHVLIEAAKQAAVDRAAVLHERT